MNYETNQERKKERKKMLTHPKIKAEILAEAIKNAKFSWYSGWEKNSGYIKSELRGENPFGAVRLYVKWKKKKPPTGVQITAEIKKALQQLWDGQQHHSLQREFAHYVRHNFYVDVKMLEREVMLHLEDNIREFIDILEKAETFEELRIQYLHNALKNLETGIDDQQAIQTFLDSGTKRIGEL